MPNVLGEVQEMARFPPGRPRLILLLALHRIAAAIVAAAAVGVVVETGIGVVDALSMKIVTGTGLSLEPALKRGGFETEMTVIENAITGTLTQIRVREIQEMIVMFVTAKPGPNQRERHTNRRRQRRMSRHRLWHLQHHLLGLSLIGRRH